MSRIVSAFGSVASLPNYVIISHYTNIICKTIIDICIKYTITKNEYFQYYR